MPVTSEQNQNMIDLASENQNLSFRIHQNTTIVPNVSKNLNSNKSNVVIPQQTLNRPKKVELTKKQSDTKL